MNFREKLRMVELSEYLNVINIFDDINSPLHTVTTIHHKVSVLVKCSHSVNLILFMVVSRKEQGIARTSEAR